MRVTNLLLRTAVVAGRIFALVSVAFSAVVAPLTVGASTSGVTSNRGNSVEELTAVILSSKSKKAVEEAFFRLHEISEPAPSTLRRYEKIHSDSRFFDNRTGLSGSALPNIMVI